MVKISAFLLSLVLFFFSFLSLVKPAHAAPWTGDCVSSGDVATVRGLQCLIANLLEPVPALIIVVALFMVIFAGAKLIMGANDPKAIASAWSTFSFAIIGILLLGGVWLILVLIEQFTGATVTQFGFQ